MSKSKYYLLLLTNMKRAQQLLTTIQINQKLIVVPRPRHHFFAAPLKVRFEMFQKYVLDLLAYISPKPQEHYSFGMNHKSIIAMYSICILNVETIVTYSSFCLP